MNQPRDFAAATFTCENHDIVLHRSIRILRTSLTILSLLLFIVSATLWPVSYFRACNYFPNTRTALISIMGDLSFTRYSWRAEIMVDPGFYSWEISPARRDGVNARRLTEPRWGRAGFAFSYYSGFEIDASVPHWFLALLFAILPTLKLRAILRARKQTRGFAVVPKSATIDSTAE